MAQANLTCGTRHTNGELGKVLRGNINAQNVSRSLISPLLRQELHRSPIMLELVNMRNNKGQRNGKVVKVV